jgi:hypothetical protein
MAKPPAKRPIANSRPLPVFEPVQDFRPTTIRRTAIPEDSPAFRHQLRQKEATIAQLGTKLTTVLQHMDAYACCHEVGLSPLCHFVRTQLTEETAGCEHDFLRTLTDEQATFIKLAENIKKQIHTVSAAIYQI